MIGLTEGQAKVLNAIKAHISKHGKSPTITEICTALGMTFKNKRSYISRVLVNLEQRGKIKRIPGGHRSIQLVREPYHIPIRPDLFEALAGYASAESISVETAVNQFVRDGLEGA
jgi:SOS-response transcriptional repressor LexA